MRPFKFLNSKLYTNGSIELSMEIIDCVIEFCEIYNRYLDTCRQTYLQSHPNIDPNSDYSFPIPHNPIERDFPEGKLWHGGTDYDESDDEITHFLYMDVPGDGDVDDYFFEVVEDNHGGLRIKEIGRDRSRWD